MASVGCPGRRTNSGGSIAGSEANVSLSAECTRSHQTGSLSITGELREHALALPRACLPASPSDGDHYCSCKGFLEQMREEM